MIPYASRTGTRSTLAALRAADWRLLVSAAGELRTEGFRYALDNGAWSAYQRGADFDEDAFKRALDALGAGADWVVCPDIVCGGEASLELSWRWLSRVLEVAPVALFAVQDGHEPWQLDEVLGARVGIFIGGSTEWKLATMRTWSAAAANRGAWCHVGRVNTARRVALCASAGVTSFDGSSVTRFPKTLPLLQRAVQRGRNQMRFAC